MLPENESEQRGSEEPSGGMLGCWVGTVGRVPPTHTHAKRQLKKAMSPRGKVRVYNNQALFIIGSMCGAGVSERVRERGEQGGKEPPGYLWRGGFRLHAICPPPLFLNMLPGFKVHRSRGEICTDQLFTQICRISCFFKKALEGVTGLNKGRMHFPNSCVSTEMGQSPSSLF